MRLVFPILAMLAAANLLFVFATMVLIWASSETSYYLQLGGVCLLFGGVFSISRGSASWWTIAGSTAVAATITAAMPLEYLPDRSIEFWDAGSVKAWLLQLMHFGVFAYGIRNSGAIE